MKADTDGDGLNDGEEITNYKTDPLKADTDDGSVDDFTEVNRGTNPLDPEDDVVKMDVPIVLKVLHLRPVKLISLRNLKLFFRVH